MIFVGIDCGRKTGYAVWEGGCQAFDAIATLPLHAALEHTKRLHATYGTDLIVVMEDARRRKWLPAETSASEYRGKLMGAGAVKRDAVIWEEFCCDHNITLLAVAPRPGLTKWDADTFARTTGWTGRTSVHARDAALLVYGRR